MLVALLLLAAPALATEWQQPKQEVLDVLHAPQLPWVWTAPSGQHLLLADPITYPDLEVYAAGWHELAGVRIAPGTGLRHADPGGLAPRILSVDGGDPVPLPLPDGAELHDVSWTADGERFALTVEQDDVVSLWVGDVEGGLDRVDGVRLAPMLGPTVRWMPDQKRLLVQVVPDGFGEEPPPPAIPAGPMVQQGDGDIARSTYESRNLLVTAHDDELFSYYGTSQLLLVDPKKGRSTPLGEPAVFTTATPSPSGKYLLVERLVGPWSHAVPWWRFASEVEVWDKKGKLVASVASLPLADEVPILGVPEGPRGVSWRSTSDHELFWVEALDGGDPVAEVDHRDRLMRLGAPFDAPAEEVWKAQHRVWSWQGRWTADGTLMLTERERMKRWLTTWLLDVDSGKARTWFDLNEDDQYNDPGDPMYEPLDNGRWVLKQEGRSVYFRGSGATDDGDRPFLDLRSLDTGRSQRLFRADAERYERIVSFAGEDRLIMRSESPTEVPNYYVATLGDEVEAPEGEATRAHERTPITRFEDPTPQLRQIDKRIVRYEREDGVPLSFQLYLPPGYEEGEPLPTVVYAYPLEYSDASTAGQVRGSTRHFDRFRGPSHLFFLLDGYAVLHRTAMPMVGDPETVYDTFVEQLVDDAEAAVAKAIEIGVADPERIGVIGHSHGGLMVANLLAHTDLFAAGIARSGSYNKTTQPFGYQSERRSLFEARDTYIQVSPTFFADQVNEPVLVIHGDADSNPGTLTFQSEVFFEGVRGSGGTARMVLLPYEDHGYQARQSVEHVLWEQLRWFDEHVKGAE